MIEGLDRVEEHLLRLVVALVFVLLAVSAHSVGQAWAASKLGDPSAEKAGRLSWLPFGHFDWIGCLLLPALMALAPQSQLILGYAKPVPVDPGRLRRPKADFSLIALVGPLANLALALGLALGCSIIFRGLRLESPAGAYLLGAALSINLKLACVNLLPLPGFDGLKALYAFLPDEWCWQFQRGERYFLLVLAFAVYFRALDWAIYPSLQLSRWLCTLAGIGLPPF